VCWVRGRLRGLLLETGVSEMQQIFSVGGLTVFAYFSAEFALRVGMHKLYLLSAFGAFGLFAFFDLLHLLLDFLLVKLDPEIVFVLAEGIPLGVKQRVGVEAIAGK